MKTKRDKKGKEGSGSVKRTLLFSLLIFCGLAIIGIGSAAAAPSVSISPASTTDLSPGDPFSIDVSVDSESYNLRACNIDLTYDSTALSVVSVTYAGLLGTAANVLDMSDPTDDGCITSSIARKTLTNPSAAASGTYITVNFEVKSGAADATYALDLSSVTLKDENNDAIPGVVVTDGTATVGEAVATPSVAISPASTTDLSPGDPFSIDVSVDSESYKLRACNIDLTYDSTALSVVSVTYAGLLGTAANVLDMSDPTDDGCITSSIARKTLTNPSAAASGTYITVNFEVKSGAADATYALDLSSVTLKDENNDAIPGVVVTDRTATVGVPVTLTWQTEPSTSVERGTGVTFDVSFSESAAYYFRIENSSGGVVWRYPTTGTNTATNPAAKTWTTTTATPTGVYTIIININGADNSNTKTFTVTEPGVTVITVSPSKATLFTGDTTCQFTASVTGVTWVCDNTSVGTISSTGLFTRVGAGTATITASKSGYADGTASVTVIAEPIKDHYDTDEDGDISKGEAIDAVNDYLFTGDINKEQAVEVVYEYLFG